MNLLEKIFKIFKNTIFAITFILDVGFNSKTSKMKLLEKIVKIFIKALTVFAIIFILDVRFNNKISKMKGLDKTVTLFIKALTIFTITFILDVGV